MKASGTGILRFLASVRSLMTIGRFSVYKCHQREDVAQHSYFTTLYAMVLADLERRKGRRVDMEKLLRMSLLHDVEESRTGDIHHPFKHHDDSFREEIDKRALEWFRRSMEGLPTDMTNDYLNFRRESRTDSLESRILRSADKLEALMWTREELKLGNEYVKEAGIMEDIMSKMKKLDVDSLPQLIEPLAQDPEGRGPVPRRTRKA